MADLADLAVWKVADLNMSDALGAADSDADSQQVHSDIHKTALVV